jgi:biotin operon repressor
MEYKINQAPEIKKKTKAPDQRHFSVIPLNIVKLPGITLGSLKVLIVLSSYCNKAGSSYVSLDRIGQDLGISRQAVGQQIKRLIKAGIVIQYNNHYKNIKGATRRIVYNDKITDQEVQKISNTPIEPYNNAEITQAYAAINISKKINELDQGTKAPALAQSRQDHNDKVTSLKMCVSLETEIVQIEKAIEYGITPDQLQEYINSGKSLNCWQAHLTPRTPPLL